MATNESQINTNHLTQLMLLNLGSRNACMRALVAHPTDLNRAANWLIEHRNDANIDSNPFAQQATTTATTTAATTTAATTTHFNPYSAASSSAAATTTTTAPAVHSQQHMIQQVMNLGYSREEALRAYTNVSTDDRSDTNKLVEYLVKNPKKDDKKSGYSYNSSSYYPYSNQNKKKVYRPVINIDDIKVEKEEICDIAECECVEHIGIMLREYKKFLENTHKNAGGDNGECEQDKDYEKNGFYAYFLSAISGDGEYTLSDVMDDFIHLLTKHDVRYGEFSKVYQYIIGEDAMDGKLDENIESFDLLRRIRFSHDSVDDAEFIKKYYFGFKSVKEITIQQLCDKMYCYLVHSYDIAARLKVDEYEALDKQYGIKSSEQIHRERQEQQKENGDDEKDISSLIKEKDISYYVGNKHYMEYASLLSKHRQRWFKSSTDDAKHKQYNKFYQVLNVDAFETRVDPKELKAKLAKEKRERLREKKRIESEQKKKEQAAAQKEKEQQDKEKEKEKEKAKEKENESEVDKEEEANGGNNDDKKTKEEEAASDKAKEPEKAKEEEAKPKESEAEKEKVEEKEGDKKEEASSISGVEEKAVNKPKASPQVLPKAVEHVDKKEFSFGVRYNYWPDMEDLIAIPISAKEAKHETLKDELTQNAECKISEFEYNVLTEKAQIYFDTEYCQENIEAGVNTFGIQILAKITKEHLIAVLVYCNYDAVRNALCSTYIRQSKDESNESMAARHAHFYHVGKLLREAVSCYGIEAHRSEKKVFYHGIAFNKRIMSDDEIKALFVYSPLSTTSLMEIALNNNCNQTDEEKENANSLILELKGYVSKYFDCAWLSDLCYEQEKLFFGGTRALTVNKCIDFLHGYDHMLFITAMKYIPDIFRTPMSGWKINKNDDMLQETKEMIRSLIFHQLNRHGDNLQSGKYPDNLGEDGIPPDSQEALQQLCTSTTEVRMHYDAMYNHRAYAFLSSLFMTPTRTFTKLDIICELFPNIETFSMMQCPLTTLTFMYLKSFISPPNEEEEKDDHKDANDAAEPSQSSVPLRCKIREIRLIDPKTAAMSIDQVIQAEEKSLAEVQWTIASPDQVSLVLRYSDTPVVIKEPTPPPSKPEVTESKDDEKQKSEGGGEDGVRRKVVVKKRIVKKRIVKKKPKQDDATSPTEAQPGAQSPESQT
eukprot:CAMPEP_0197021952 /NCGR_PEP_ID=MMETSP1384-20130603/2834_1 /TAXON_ID=29189 /ORGANISM="Ammonia sp." /LENGTH=1167 /DNA_ID=CAMNT_0042449889 /DNA_START=36 /DNA_END=3539 /DNA_ORIENTATION=+